MSRPASRIDCEGKERFTSRHLAGKVAGKIARREGMPMRIYPCSMCRGLHVGSALARR